VNAEVIPGGQFKPGEPVTFGGSPVAEANVYVQRRAFAEYLVALVEEFPEVRAELRRLLLEES
jgi:hypothetical protein